jgi:hypothetical protein
MKFNSLTYKISVAILVITIIYTFLYSGITGLLLCSAVTLITAAFIDQFEIVVAISIIFALFYTYYLKKLLRRFEPFQNANDTSSIINRLDKMKGGSHSDTVKEPTGVYNPSVEGFEDVQPKVAKDGESQHSSSAPAKRDNEVDTKNKDKDKKDGDILSEEFSSATNELFKVGKMPSEHSTGPQLDAGSTLMKAMESFNPSQINSMTDDTKKLLETQKSLMGMLTQMRPVLADGKELLQTFSGMFGGSGGGFKL